MIYNIANSKQIDIQAGDWIDVEVATVGTPDPVWGNSIHVYDVDGEYVWCDVWNGLSYEQAACSPELVVDNYRKVPYES